MSIKSYSREEIAETSMIEIANEILSEERQTMHFNELFDKIAELKGFTEEQKKANVAQLYTYMNTDGRFMTVGSNMWGLKRWYPVEQQVEEVQAPVKKKKAAAKKPKAKAKAVEEDLDTEVEEDIEDDLDLDDEELDLDDDGEENSGLDEDFDINEETEDGYTEGDDDNNVFSEDDDSEEEDDSYYDSEEEE